MIPTLEDFAVKHEDSGWYNDATLRDEYLRFLENARMIGALQSLLRALDT